MLYQLHRQNNFPPYESQGMVAQKEVTTVQDLQAFINDNMKKYALDNKEQWLLVEEDSELFELEVST